ncbi:fumarylacetoacetate hydrolase family protein [Rhodoplanes sp. Z2-YC6860]|uniref:fumarylacetoacetate hydrolase family protein n=1 Tax=Rhodoplanes sp. Z2-YC6860 TaxID=674703 RepID=UPI00078BB181|nr:fumarylacetoacetate hydrolase family protein [Rhodoplanes sp. Z2-YC6860]AMN40055.1 5-carboxymethyl-2-hydroxymuconate delta-isomerase [Rhodoplanes sp. Z2-YC6860]
MNGRAFKLGTFAKSDGKPFAAIVLDDAAIPLDEAAKASGKSGLTSTASIRDLLGDWDRNFATLQEIVAGLDKAKGTSVSSLTALPPVAHPGKMFYAAQNFQEHVDEMIRAGMSPKDGPKFTGEKSTSDPYLFLKAPSCLAGAYDDIPAPKDVKKIDWEAEIACVITKPAKRVKAERAMDHVAGWMTTNDVSARDFQIRTDRPGLRSDWLNGKSHDKFAPMGPYLVPKAFVADHMKLFIRLSINGEIKQNGNTSQFIFTPEEQIEYASNILTLNTADIFVCGTCGGVGQGTNTFIKVGDVMETEVEGLGKMRNKFVAEA